MNANSREAHEKAAIRDFSGADVCLYYRGINALKSALKRATGQTAKRAQKTPGSQPGGINEYPVEALTSAGYVVLIVIRLGFPRGAEASED